MNISKKIRIICEEAYAESIWCKQLLGGFLKELKKRRIGYEKYSQVCDFSEDDSVCIIGMSNVWITKTIGKCNEKSCVPIVLSNQSQRFAEGSYHLICPDIRGVVKGLAESFEDAVRTKIALYGGDRAVDLDRDRTEIFSRLVQEGNHIYQNAGNLENCFRSFLPKADRYDAVICVNGYAAVSLVKKLEKENPKLLEKLVIISCEEVLRHSKYNQWISLVDLKLESYGAAAMAVLDMYAQRSDISTITVEMKGEVCQIPKKDEESHLPTDEKAGVVLEDPEIICMAKIEQLMQEADDMDHHIIAMLLDNAKYSEIADSCYMTEGNVKYRVKKYMSICDCKTKKELLELLQEYLQ